MCLSCGHDGRDLQGEGGPASWSCPRCGADLYARPPRSYAELEGLDEAPASTAFEAGATRGYRRLEFTHGPHPMKSRRRGTRRRFIAAVLGGVCVAGLVALTLLSVAPWLADKV